MDTYTDMDSTSSISQAIGATTPLFTAGMALLLLKQYETRRVYLTLVPVVVGTSCLIATPHSPGPSPLLCCRCAAVAAMQRLRGHLIPPLIPGNLPARGRGRTHPTPLAHKTFVRTKTGLPSLAVFG